ncbi:hypothetical protein EV702DRAFT_1194530 [Suillus placidus]|uniref:Uncharacterized protein n=1 Tax=Suillus placidus TaxID=48579 RepID=A0A9P7A0T6_9AGAM|nr:hypothetical protein EV702DRAFT_1194530 [Suillus placidus]
MIPPSRDERGPALQTIPPSCDEQGPALQTTPYDYGHGRALPVPSYGQHLEVPQGRGYPGPRRDQIDYQRTAQPLQVMNPVLGVNAAAYSHPQYAPPCNDMYLHAPRHHTTNAAHMATYDTRAPAHQQYSEDYGVHAPVRPPACPPSQQQQYLEVYSRAPARTPSQQQYMETYDTYPPAPQQHTETRDARIPTPQPHGPQQHTETYDTHVPVPQQGLVGYRDSRGAYNVPEGWHPHYGSMAYQAEDVQTPRSSSPRLSPLPALMEYSSSPPWSEGN